MKVRKLVIVGGVAGGASAAAKARRCSETAKMAVPPGNRPAAPRDWFRGVP